MTALEFLNKFLSAYQEGRLLLPPGSYAYNVKTRGTPNLVWLAEATDHCRPVCHGGINTFGVEYLDDGFILFADIKTEGAEVLWQAFMEQPCNESDCPRLV